MDKKSKRHVVGEPTRRSDRKQSKSGPPSKYKIKTEEPRASSSARKLSSGQLDSVTVNPSVGYRLINFIDVFTAISAHVKCKVCGSDVEFCESSRRGLGFKIVINCKSCTPKEITLYPLIKNAYEVNRRFIFAMRLLGVSLGGAEKFCAFMDLPRPIFQSFYDTIVGQIRDATESIKTVSFELAGEEEKKLTAEKCGKVDGLTVSGNGTWRKRGFSSLDGATTLIGYQSKKVIDICVKSAYCKVCALWKGKTDSEEYQNWLENQGKMEADAMLEMFQRAEELHETKYVNYIGDGDSKTYNKIVQTLSYDVKKKECVNHVQKRMGTRLRNCKKGNKGLGGKGKLTGKLIGELTAFYGLAIRRNSGSLEDMKKAVWATFYHKCFTDASPKHQYCPEGEDSWCSWQQANPKGTLNDYTHNPALHAKVIEAIKPIYVDLSKDELLERCLGAFHQNNNECLNSVIWKFAPKTSWSGRPTVETAANIASILFNNGHIGLINVLEILEMKIGEAIQQYCLNIDEKRICDAEHEAEKNMHEGHLRAKHGKNYESLNAEELLYSPGIAD